MQVLILINKCPGSNPGSSSSVVLIRAFTLINVTGLFFENSSYNRKSSAVII